MESLPPNHLTFEKHVRKASGTREGGSRLVSCPAASLKIICNGLAYHPGIHGGGGGGGGSNTRFTARNWVTNQQLRASRLE